MKSPMEETCDICGVKPGVDCTNQFHPGEPLPGREHHIGRSETHAYCLRCGNVHEAGKCGR